MQSTTTSTGQWRQRLDPIDWSHPPPSWAVPAERHVHSINQCNLSGTLAQQAKRTYVNLIELFWKVMPATSNSLQMAQSPKPELGRRRCAREQYAQSLPQQASIFSAELHAVHLALLIIRDHQEERFVIFTDSLSSVQAIVIIYHDFIPTPRRGSHVKSDKTHTQSSRYTP